MPARGEQNCQGQKKCLQLKARLFLSLGGLSLPGDCPFVSFLSSQRYFLHIHTQVSERFFSPAWMPPMVLSLVLACQYLWILPHWCAGLHSILFVYLFISFIYFWLHWVFIAARGFSLVAASGGSSSLLCTGFSLRWLLLLRSMSSRRASFSSCGTQAQ